LKGIFLRLYKKMGTKKQNAAKMRSEPTCDAWNT
jgi:hypothetical protein